MDSSRALLFALAGLVLGGVLGALWIAPALRAHEGAGLERATDAGGAAGRLPGEAAGKDGEAPDASDPASEPASLEGAPVAKERYDELQARVRTLEKEKTDLQAKVEKLGADLEAAQTKPLDPQAFRFGVPKSAPAFDKADWTELADHVVKLRKVLGDLPAQVESEGKDFHLTPATAHALQQHNTPLAMFAVGFGNDVSDATPNGAYTHPAVLANLIRAELLAAGDP